MALNKTTSFYREMSAARRRFEEEEHERIQKAKCERAKGAEQRPEPGAGA